MLLCVGCCAAKALIHQDYFLKRSWEVLWLQQRQYMYTRSVSRGTMCASLAASRGHMSTDAAAAGAAAATAAATAEAASAEE